MQEGMLLHDSLFYRLCIRCMHGILWDSNSLYITLTNLKSFCNTIADTHHVNTLMQHSDS